MYRVRRLSSDNAMNPKYIRQSLKHPVNLMFWGSFSHNNVGPLIRIDGYMNSSKYIEVLEDKVKIIFHKENSILKIFQDDNAPCHSSKSVNGWFH